jgi:hypothetical protein
VAVVPRRISAAGPIGEAEGQVIVRCDRMSQLAFDFRYTRHIHPDYGDRTPEGAALSANWGQSRLRRSVLTHPEKRCYYSAVGLALRSRASIAVTPGAAFYSLYIESAFCFLVSVGVFVTGLLGSVFDRNLSMTLSTERT